MDNKEREKLLKLIKEKRKAVLKSKETSTQYLISLGFLNKNGELKPKFK